ncbi:MAG TPA: DMT family transporter [Alphaproteobacteria bacterium]|nr:DMT family transporter [Alphaproteobacteria bacterium]USO04843.1 MAG: DMT family transporter [Rhodospirillales bacterium]HOO80909.1 DMT family transporter [Alphaproteobacteria bacterium]
MFNHLHPSHKGIVLAFIGFTAFAFSDVVSKWLLQYYSTYQVVFINHSTACLYLLAALHMSASLKTLKRSTKISLHLFRGVLNTCVALSVIFSFSRLPIADVYAFLFTVPFFSALLGVAFYKQAIGLHRGLAIVIGFTGVVIGLQPGSEGFSPWLIVPILAGFLIALKFTISRSLEGENTLLLGLWPLLVSAPLAGLLSISSFEMLNFTHFAMHLFTGLCIATGLVCVSQAFRIAPAAAVSPILYTEMIWALLFGFLIFGDAPDLMMMVGAGIIILSGIYLVETERRNGRSNIKVKS